MINRLTVKDLKNILQKYKVPDDAIICCQSDEEGNRTMVCMDAFVELVGRRDSTKIDGKWYDFTAGDDVLGIDMEKDKGKCFITFRPMY